MWWRVSADVLGPRDALLGLIGGLPITMEGWGYVRTEVARGVQRVLLCENARVASRSRDRFGFSEGGVVYIGGGGRGGTGGVGVCRGCVGGCTMRGWGCSWPGGVCVSL